MNNLNSANKEFKNILKQNIDKIKWHFLSANTSPAAGFIGYKALENQKKSLLFGSETKGRGSLIYLVDNVLFRGFWYSGKMVFANALFF